MRINGEWHEDEYGDIRPTVGAALLDHRGEWVRARFLIDTGADRTLLSFELFNTLGLSPKGRSESLGSVGGLLDVGIVTSTLSLERVGGGDAFFNVSLAASMKPDAVGLNVLGRDILDYFALILDRPGNTICMLRDKHVYQVVQQR